MYPVEVLRRERRERMERSGFTTIELIIVVLIIGVIAAIGFPKIRGTLDKTNVRSARVYLSTELVTARATAVQRGCYAVVHFTSGASGAIWVTACPRRMPGAGTVDTIGGGRAPGAPPHRTQTPRRGPLGVR